MLDSRFNCIYLGCSPLVFINNKMKKIIQNANINQIIPESVCPHLTIKDVCLILVNLFSITLNLFSTSALTCGRHILCVSQVFINLLLKYLNYLLKKQQKNSSKILKIFIKSNKNRIVFFSISSCLLSFLIWIDVLFLIVYYTIFTNYSLYYILFIIKPICCLSIE